jgi:hypothetical protein
MRRMCLVCCLLAMYVEQWAKPLQYVERGVCHQHRRGLCVQSGDCRVQLYLVRVRSRRHACAMARAIRRWLIFCRVCKLCMCVC